MLGRSCLAAMSLGLYALIGSAALAEEAVIQLPASGNDRMYRVTEPTVTQRSTEYPTITFQPGDTVYVRAGGCVQTGGSGPTWKRYVNPAGPNSDRLYHGQFMIPGAMSNLTNLADFIQDAGSNPWSQPLVVPLSGGWTPSRNLTLGYVDDDYHDNGYWGHDNGNFNQCQGVGNAWFEVYIRPH